MPALGSSAAKTTLGIRDSQGYIHATSVICAPIRQGRQIVGLVHLYATDENHRPDPDDLEFTLAVADNLALALKNLSRHQILYSHGFLNRIILKIFFDNLRLNHLIGGRLNIILCHIFR